MPLSTLWLAAAMAAPPADVTRFMARMAQCRHWAGEEPYDHARSIEIAAAMRQLRCATIDADAKRLRRLHARNQAALKGLRAADDD